jgi:predicted nucleic acid-binding protein
MVYCDASFIIPLYADEPEFSGLARRAAAEWTDAPVMSPLTELEIVNTFQRKAFISPMSAHETQKCLRHFEADCRDGIYQIVHGNMGAILREARILSVQHSATGGYRSLDLLHIAAAKILGAVTFLSFDARLNALARKEKLRVLK